MATATTYKNEQKTLKEAYLQALATEVWQNDEKMIEYIGKNIASIIETEKGYLIAIEKPSIETSFCFGYSLSRYDSEDFDRANEMADYARKSEEYFIEQNLKQLTEWLDILDSGDVYICKHYWKSPRDTKIKQLSHKGYWEFQNLTEEQKKDYEPISGKDKEIIKAAYEREIENFKKRLNTYLKRYGTSKLHTWSYWQDE